jgi:transcriptional regulator with XRE-family HTH domain
MRMTTHPIKQFRLDTGRTQTALAKELGVTDVTICRWETGVRQVDTDLLPKVAELTGISAAKLRPDLAKLICEGTD